MSDSPVPNPGTDPLICLINNPPSQVSWLHDCRSVLEPVPAYRGPTERHLRFMQDDPGRGQHLAAAQLETWTFSCNQRPTEHPSLAIPLCLNGRTHGRKRLSGWRPGLGLKIDMTDSSACPSPSWLAIAIVNSFEVI